LFTFAINNPLNKKPVHSHDFVGICLPLILITPKKEPVYCGHLRLTVQVVDIPAVLVTIVTWFILSLDIICLFW